MPRSPPPGSEACTLSSVMARPESNPKQTRRDPTGSKEARHQQGRASTYRPPLPIRPPRTHRCLWPSLVEVAVEGFAHVPGQRQAVLKAGLARHDDPARSKSRSRRRLDIWHNARPRCLCRHLSSSNTARSRMSQSGSAAQRNPICPELLSTVLLFLAATRYRLQ